MQSIVNINNIINYFKPFFSEVVNDIQEQIPYREHNIYSTAIENSRITLPLNKKKMHNLNQKRKLKKIE